MAFKEYSPIANPCMDIQYIDDIARLGLKQANLDVVGKIKPIIDKEITSLNNSILKGYSMNGYYILTSPDGDRPIIAFESPCNHQYGLPYGTARGDEFEMLNRALSAEYSRIKNEHKVEILGFINGFV